MIVALLVWFAMPLLFMLPPLGAVFGALLETERWSIPGSLALGAFAALYLFLAFNLRPWSAAAAAWIQRAEDPPAAAGRGIAIGAVAPAVFFALGWLLERAIALWRY